MSSSYLEDTKVCTRKRRRRRRRTFSVDVAVFVVVCSLYCAIVIRLRCAVAVGDGALKASACELAAAFFCGGFILRSNRRKRQSLLFSLVEIFTQKRKCLSSHCVITLQMK